MLVNTTTVSYGISSSENAYPCTVTALCLFFLDHILFSRYNVLSIAEARSAEQSDIRGGNIYENYHY